ncbi:hypothetical protein O7A70_28090 [Mesorhizobium sp. Cs1299R1N1]|uniref:hypothetical protein n=2 Tax=unclassified Mesorhizobium TaxID=325217 RepID=UPI00301DA19F
MDNAEYLISHCLARFGLNERNRPVDRFNDRPRQIRNRIGELADRHTRIKDRHLLSREYDVSSSDDTMASRIDMAVDQEITSLLAAMEQEQVPDRLTKLAMELQNALIEKRRREVKN